MLIGAAVLFIVATVAGMRSAGWIGGGPAANARFLALICVALFMLSFLCFMVSWKLACPPADHWFNVECFRAATIGKAL